MIDKKQQDEEAIKKAKARKRKAWALHAAAMMAAAQSTGA